MSGSTVEPIEWTTRKRVLSITAAFAIQILLILWVSAQGPLHPRKAQAGTTIQLAAEARSDLLSLRDPTLFPLAHPNGISGRAWLTVAPHSFQPEESATAPQWLGMTLQPAGESLREFVGRHLTLAWIPAERTPPTFGREGGVPVTATPTTSTIRVEGVLTLCEPAGLAPSQSWPSSDILAPSVVRVLIDELGNPITVVLVSSCGVKAADHRAIEIARTTHFSPAKALATGRLVFQWHTLPMPGAETGVMSPH
jgi:TonB family protein